MSGNVQFDDPVVDEVASGRRSTDGQAMVQLQLCGIRIDHLSKDRVLDCVRDRLDDSASSPLAIGSINLDHVHHFGDHRTVRPVRLGVNLDWRMVVDGAPVVRRAAALTGLPWSRLPGADLLPDMLGLAERSGAKVGFLGGYPDTIPGLRATLAARWPDLRPASFWTPSRAVVNDRRSSQALAADIAEADVGLLVVGLGKPRQERWIETHGVQTRARVLGAFGAAADFLAGSARRAPEWMQRAGCEWAFRLAQEPHRLSRRYLVEGPAALLAMRQATPIVVMSTADKDTAELAEARGQLVTESLDEFTASSPWPPAREPSPRW